MFNLKRSKKAQDQPVAVEISAEDYAFLEQTAAAVGSTPSDFLSLVIKMMRAQSKRKK